MIQVTLRQKCLNILKKSHLLLSIVSLDCTSQTNETGNSHMNWEENLKLIAELKRKKTRHR